VTRAKPEASAVGGTGRQLPAPLEPGPAERDRERLLDGRAWAEFCDRLRAAGEIVLAPGAPDTPLDRAEGFRYLATLAAAGIRHAFDLADVDRPRFLRNPDSASKWGAENADNVYLLAKIRSDRSYRIVGRRNRAYTFLIETKEGYMQLGQARNFATLEASELEIGPDGRFEIALSRDRRPGNWLPLHPDATQVLIRQYLWDWENEEPAEFRIFQEESAGLPAEPLEPVRVARLLDEAGHWTLSTAQVWADWVAGLRRDHVPGRLAKALRFVGGADDIRYGNDAYRLAPDEALVLEFEPPDARYWHVQLVDLWFGTMDYTNRVTSLNGQQLRADADGRVRVVIAHRDPGVPNWLDTAGHLEGLIQYRYIWTKNDPEPSARIVHEGDVRAALPPGTPRVSPEERRRTIARRQAHVAWRERP
jgi:hypothetical protein